MKTNNKHAEYPFRTPNGRDYICPNAGICPTGSSELVPGVPAKNCRHALPHGRDADCNCDGYFCPAEFRCVLVEEENNAAV